MQERWGAASNPAARISVTVSRVPSRVEPPAPKVTEKNFGFSCPSCFHVSRSLSLPSGVLGGKNSKLNVRGNLLCDCIAFFTAEARRRGENRAEISAPLRFGSVTIVIRLVGAVDVETHVTR